MPRLLAGNSLGVEAIWQHKAPSVWSRRIANLPLLTCRHGQIPAPDGSSSAQCFAQPSLPPMCRSGAPFSGDIHEPCHGQALAGPRHNYRLRKGVSNAVTQANRHPSGLTRYPTDGSGR